MADVESAEPSSSGAGASVKTIASTSRSVASTSAVSKVPTLRPARKQVTHREVENLRQTADKSNQSGLSYNIWYNKWSGGDKEDGSINKTKAQTRVDIARDAGYTRADANGGAFVCLFFARGYCPNGAECSYLHALPRDSPDQSHDIFGRAKHGDYRDDMGGVGSVQRVNRTLYVGRFVEESDSARISSGGGANLPASMSHMNGKSNGDQPLHQKYNRFATTAKGWHFRMPKSEMSNTEKVLHRHFSEFGEIERLRVLHTRGCGFVTYLREVDAQFAKEAMMHQSLDHDECINLRWATDDPNPGAQKRDQQQREQQGMAAIRDRLSDEAIAAGQSLLELEEASRNDFDADAPSKRLRIENGHINGATSMSEEEYTRLLEENQRNWADMQRQDAQLQEQALTDLQRSRAAGSRVNGAASDDPTQSSPFDKKTLEALQRMRARHASSAVSAPASKPVKRPAPSSALGGLADYGSDSDEG